MKYAVKYDGPDRQENDRQAIADVRGYLSPKQWKLFMDVVESPNPDPIKHTKTVNFLMGLVGVKGYPFHAFCRKYLLEAYRLWMASGEDGDPVPTDEEGFPL